MSPQAIADPEDLERFARDLNAFTANVKDSVGRLNGAFSRLGETWRDQEQQKFAYEYQETVRAFNRFCQTAETYIPLLQAKARDLRRYLGQG